MRSFDQDIGAVIARLERHARAADQTAVATELLVAAVFRKEAERRQQQELKIQCEMWLKPADVKHVHLHQVSVRLDGTCNWIASNGAFRRWAESGLMTVHDRLLVISGTHGCGKSVLASSIVVRLNEDDRYTLFFAFSSSDGSRQNFGDVVKALIWQLLVETKNSESVDIVQRLRLEGRRTFSELWEAFTSIIASLVKPVYCIIDGIDECTDFDRTISRKIVQTLETCTNLRVLLLGRPHVLQAHSHNLDSLKIEITSTMLKQDLEIFINDEIAKSAILSLLELRETVFRILKDKSNGMFLWVRLMVDDLKRSSSKSELRERLQSLPCGLEDAFQIVFWRLSHKLDEYEQLFAQNTLALMTVCCRPLHFSEIRYLHALRCRSLATAAQPLEEYLLLQPPQRILDIFGGLVSMADGFLHFIHSSVREFLVRSEDRWTRVPDGVVLDFRVDTINTHRSFSWLCLDHLALVKKKKEHLKPDISQSVSSLHDSHPLLQYATLYTFFHLNRSGPLCSKTLAKISRIFESAQSIFWVEHFAHYLFKDVALDSQVNEFMALEERMTEAGLSLKLFTLFQGNSKEMIAQMRNPEGNAKSRADQWEMLLDLAQDGEVETFNPGQSNELTNLHFKPSSDGPDLCGRSSVSKLKKSKDPSTAVSRIGDLLKGQDSLPVAHQIEIFLRLQTSLRNARILADPLKVLFQVILRKASGISVYVLKAIADFYKRLEKFQEALEVYTVAFQKIETQDISLKFSLQRDIGHCYLRLGLNTEAMRCYENAFSGREILLGKRHSETIDSLDDMIYMSFFFNHNYTELFELYNKMFMGQDFASDIDIGTNLTNQSRQALSYLKLGDLDKAVHMKDCVQATLELYHESPCQDRSMTALPLYTIGLVHRKTNDNYSALKYLSLALEVYKKYEDSTVIFRIKREIALLYEDLDRHHEAIKILEMIHAEQHFQEEFETGLLPYMINRLYAETNNSDAALVYLKNAIEDYRKSNNSTMILHVQYWIALVYDAFGRHHDAQNLLELVHAEQKRALPKDHKHIQLTEKALKDLSLKSNHNSRPSSRSSGQ